MSLISTITFLFLIALASAHIKLIYPGARSGDSDILAYPCGPFYFWEDDISTTLSPGKVTISIAETMAHNGAALRFALSYDSDDHYDELVLLDHVPHYDTSSPGTLYVDLDIPNVQCTRCALQVISVRTDDFSNGNCCNYPFSEDFSYECRTVYHSCSNIVITGTVPILDWAATYKYNGPCGPYTTESNSGSWQPYSDGMKFDSTSSIVNQCEGFKSFCSATPTSTSTSTSALTSSTSTPNATVSVSASTSASTSQTSQTTSSHGTSTSTSASGTSTSASGTATSTHASETDFVPTDDFTAEKEPFIIYIVLVVVILATIALIVYALLIRPKQIASSTI